MFLERISLDFYQRTLREIQIGHGSHIVVKILQKLDCLNSLNAFQLRPQQEN